MIGLVILVIAAVVLFLDHLVLMLLALRAFHFMKCKHTQAHEAIMQAHPGDEKKQKEQLAKAAAILQKEGYL